MKRRSMPKTDLMIRAVAIRLFLTCWLIYGLHFATNTVREIYPALSLGDHFSIDVSEYNGLHPDIFELPGRGVFINNNPGASFLGAIPYALTRPVVDAVVNTVQQTREANPGYIPEYDSIYPMAREFFQESYRRGYDIKFGLAAGVMQVLLMAPLSALSVVVVYFVLLNLTRKSKESLILALFYAFATPIFYRTAQLNHNLLQSHFALFAFVLLWKPWNTTQQVKAIHWLFAGLFAGYTLVLDYSGVVIIIALGCYAFARWISTPVQERKLSLIATFGVGVLLSVAMLLGYQWIAFGNPLLPAQYYMPATTYSGHGFNGIDWPQASLFFELALNYRYGLFISAPFLLLALYVPAWFRQDLRIVAKRETIFILLFSLVFFLFTSANQFARMQFNSGIRHVVPVTPFLFLIAAGVFLKIPRWLQISFGVVTLYWSWCLAMYRDVELGAGIFEALTQITLGGPQLPWLMTLKRLGMIPDWVSAWIIFLFAGIILWGIWAFQFRLFTKTSQNLVVE
jgi:hypothetical protein